MAETPPKKQTLLAVDDDKSILSIIKGYLEPQGYTVLTATTGPEATRLVATAHPSVVLLDLNLHGLSGFDLLREIKKLNPSIQVIIVTGSHKEDEARKAIELGAWDYVTKPIDFDYLKSILLFHNQ